MMGDRLRIADEPRRAPELKRIIQRIATTPGVAGKKYWERFRTFGRFLKAPSDHRPLPFELIIVTTNYDMCAESALAVLGHKARPVLQAQRCSHGQGQVMDLLYAPDGILLLKLHGSANWFEQEGEEGTIQSDDRVVTVGMYGEEPGQLPFVCASDYEIPGTPVIVPPTFIKPDLSNALERIWRKAASELRSADYVTFVGYSFPPTDTEMRYFIGRALAANVGLRNIYVFDVRAAKIVERLRDSASGYGQHFGELLVPIEGDWTGSQLPF
jgi:SIR2-like protein